MMVSNHLLYPILLIRIYILAWLIAFPHDTRSCYAQHGAGSPTSMGNGSQREMGRVPADEIRYQSSSRSRSTAISSMGPHRKMLIESPKFVYCSKADIIILQGRSSPMPSGIPTFSVQILNMCGNSNNRRNRRHSCAAAVSDVHVSCGWFASAKLVNPRVFRRIKFNDCLVNNGAPIRAGLRGSGGAVRSKEVAEGVRGGREGFAGETEADRPGLIRGSNLESLPGAGGEVMMINRVISRDEPGLRTHSAANHGTTMLDARIRPHHQQMQQQQTKKKKKMKMKKRRRRSELVSSKYNHECTSRDISISQSRDEVNSAGIPRFVVQIVNTCMTGCVREVHVSCGWFASAGTINPRVFRRVAFNDCVVNAGGVLPAEAILRFTYSNSFMYPLSLKSAVFC